MSSLYVAYRYGEDAALGGRVFDRLVARFGAAAVAREHLNVVGEAERVRESHQAARNSQIVVVVMGTHWIDASDQSGSRLLDQPNDPLRVLLGEAMKRRVRILPLLADGCVMPPSSELPDDLASLTTINALELDSGRRFEDDMRRILTILSQWLGLRDEDKQEATKVERTRAPNLWNRTAHVAARAVVAVFSVPAAVGQRRDNPRAIWIFLIQAALFGVGSGVALGLLLQQLWPSIAVGLGITVFYGTLYLLFEWRLLIAVFSALPWSAFGWWLGGTWAMTIHQTAQTTPVKQTVPLAVCVALGFFGLALNLSLYRRSSIWQSSGTDHSSGTAP